MFSEAKYTNFEGGARAEKMRFIGQKFLKRPKIAFIFQKFDCGKIGQNRVIMAI